MIKPITLFASLLIASSVFAASPALASATGSWKLVGDVQGVPVILTCALVEAESKITGSCIDSENKAHVAKGTTKDKNVGWSFDTEYQGTPITLTMTAVIDETGAKMSGSIDVTPMAVDGVFTATLLPATAPAAAPTAPAPAAAPATPAPAAVPDPCE